MSKLKWTLEKCIEESLKYSYRIEFERGAPGAYSRCLRMGWGDVCFGHMEKKSNGVKKYSMEQCREEMSKYETMLEFRSSSINIYNAMVRNGWLEVCTPKDMKVRGKYWNPQTIEKEALRYTSRNSFSRGSSTAYQHAASLGILDLVCGHMEGRGNLHAKKEYSISFKDGSIYVGVTCNPRVRIYSHLFNSSNLGVRNKITSGEIACIEVGNEWLEWNVACLSEKNKILLYSQEDDSCLNISSGGQKGGNFTIWSKEACLTEALKYPHRINFARGSPSCYQTCRKRGWLVGLCAHDVSSKPLFTQRQTHKMNIGNVISIR